MPNAQASNRWQFETYQSAVFARDSNHLFVSSPTEESAAKYPFDFTVMLTSVVSSARRFFAWAGVERVERLEDLVKLDEIHDSETPGIKICSDAILYDPDAQGHLQKVYAILFHDQAKNRFVIAKRNLNKDEPESANSALYRAELLREWASDPLSRLPSKKFEPLKLATHSFKFIYTAILWYWAVWAIHAIILAIFFGAGFSAFSLAVTTSPVIAFVLPVGLAVLQYGFQILLAHRNRHSANNYKAHALLENLVMLKKVAARPAEGAFTERTALERWAAANPGLAPVPEANLVQQRIQSIKPKFRKLTSALVNFVKYFVITASVVAPLYDLLAVNGIAVSNLPLVGGLPMLVVPILLALVVGSVFAYFSFTKAKERKTNLQTELTDAVEKLQTEYSELVYEVRLRRAYLDSIYPRDTFQGRSLDKLAHHSIEQAPLTRWVQFKKFCRRALPFVRGISNGGSFAFLLIAFIGTFAQLGLLTSFSYFSPWILAPLIGASVIWAALSLIDFVQKRGLRQARESLNTLPAAIAIYRHKNEALKSLEIDLKRNATLRLAPGGLGVGGGGADPAVLTIRADGAATPPDTAISSSDAAVVMVATPARPKTS